MARRRAERQRMQAQRAADHEQTKAENERLDAEAHAPQGNGIHAVLPGDESAPAAGLPHGVGSAPADEPPPMSKKEVNKANRAERQREHEDQLRINEEMQRAAKESAQKAISDREASQLARDQSLTSTLTPKP